MDFFGTLLWPIRWVIELILVGFHTFWTSIGLPPGDGWTWLLSITGLVLVVRSAMIPLMVRQIKSQRSMMDIQPELQKIQAKYKGKRDQFSMEAMRRETMEVYQRSGSNPMASCWPLLVQMPIFLGLFNVLNGATRDQSGVGLLNAELAHYFANASIWGAPLRATLLENNGNVTVIVIAVTMVVVMTISQFVTQKQIMSKNISEATKESPFYRQQQIMLYVLPLVFAVSGVAFPLGVMAYWLISNFWTMGQQFVVIRQMPTPGSQAAKEREARLRRKGKWQEPEVTAKGGEDAAQRPVSGQRAQPLGKNRAKKDAARRQSGSDQAPKAVEPNPNPDSDTSSGSAAASKKPPRGTGGGSGDAAGGSGARKR